MTTYKFSRFLAGAVRAGGLLSLAVTGFLFAAGNSFVAGKEGVVIALGAIGIVLLLFGSVAVAVFDASEALQRAFPPGETNYSLKRTDRSLRD